MYHKIEIISNSSQICLRRVRTFLLITWKSLQKNKFPPIRGKANIPPCIHASHLTHLTQLKPKGVHFILVAEGKVDEKFRVA